MGFGFKLPSVNPTKLGKLDKTMAAATAASAALEAATEFNMSVAAPYTYIQV